MQAAITRSANALFAPLFAAFPRFDNATDASAFGRCEQLARRAVAYPRQRKGCDPVIEKAEMPALFGSHPSSKFLGKVAAALARIRDEVPACCRTHETEELVSHRSP